MRPERSFGRMSTGGGGGDVEDRSSLGDGETDFCDEDGEGCGGDGGGEDGSEAGEGAPSAVGSWRGSAALRWVLK